MADSEEQVVQILAVDPGYPASNPYTIIPKELHAALLSAQRNLGKIRKDATNNAFDYAYSSAEEVLTVTRASLNLAGLTATRSSYELCEMSNDWSHCLLKTVFTLHHSASMTSADFPLTFPVLSGRGRPLDKAVLAALTTTLAYWLRDLMLAPRGDDESIDSRDHEPPVRYSDHRSQRPEPPNHNKPGATFGASFGYEIGDRLTKAGQSVDPLREKLISTGRASLCDGHLPEWDESLKPFVLKWVERAEVVAKKADGKESDEAGGTQEPEPEPESEPETKPEPELEPQRIVWKIKNPKPNHPAYWRKKLLATLKKDIAKRVKDGEEKEGVWGEVELLETLETTVGDDFLGDSQPGPDADAGAAAKRYSEICKSIESGDYNSSALYIPF